MAIKRFVSDVVKGVFSNDYQRDYQHADRTFRSRNYALLPKTRRWWHVAFRMNPAATDSVQQWQKAKGLDLKDRTRSGTLAQDPVFTQLSVVAKTVKLPSYKFDVKTYNQYNRRVLGVHKINYDPVDISFHDDALSVVRSFWEAYYVYHVQDARYTSYATHSGQGLDRPFAWQQDQSTVSTLYGTDLDFESHWGLDTVDAEPGSEFNRKQPFFQDIRIYHFSRPVDTDRLSNYTEYVLVNPVITSFAGDTLDYTDSGPSSNSMTVEYETVLMSQGQMDPENVQVASWSAVEQSHYDRSASPLSRPQASVFGTAGLLDSVTGIQGALASGDVLGAAITAGRTVDTWRRAGGISAVAGSVLGEAVVQSQNAMITIQQNNQSGEFTQATPNPLSAKAKDAVDTVKTGILKLPQKV